MFQLTANLSSPKQQEQNVGDKVMHSACNQSFSLENHAGEKLEKLCQGVPVPPSPDPSENLANRTSQSKALGHPGAKSLNDLPNLAIFSGLFANAYWDRNIGIFLRVEQAAFAEIASVDNQHSWVDCLRTKDICYQIVWHSTHHDKQLAHFRNNRDVWQSCENKQLRK